MNGKFRGASPVRGAKKALLLTLLMVITSLSPLMTVNPVSAHENGNSTGWEKQFCNDTGWVQLEGFGADPTIGMSANANWGIEFAP